MSELKYYFSIFLRRLHYFLMVAVVISAVAVIAAISLPPAYESQTRLLVEGPSIPRELAASTVNIGSREQLEIIEQRLMTRANLLDVARSQNVFDNIGGMSADAIVEGMRARTTIEGPGRRDPSPILTLTFQARRPDISAAVLSDYLTLIEQQNAEFRSARAGNTLEFFQQEVERLGADLDAQSARILEFKTENSESLPENLQLRLNQQASMQEEIRRIDRDIAGLRNQSERLVQIFEATGQVESGDGGNLSPDERRLREMRGQLDEALSLYSESNPQVTMLQARIDRLEDRVAARAAEQSDTPEDEAGTDEPTRGSATLELQLNEIETRISMLQEQRAETRERLDNLKETLEKTPANSVALDELTRSYANIEEQYNMAVDRLSRASTGERIESMSRGGRISVIEPPATPNRPTKPNRVMIAGGGTAFGLVAGLALVVLIELLNGTARRPEDIIKRVGVRPLATIPYMHSRGEVVRKRMVKGIVYVTILVGVPAAVYAVHVFYLPLDLLADKLMNRLGVRL
ncbi:GumC family protein [Roseovarius tibetensis]|uniref:GumC family protein n=1 Tax=Roseovarius tibetensis TaxID=2685897 RepID=UPI003D7FB5DB